MAGNPAQIKGYVGAPSSETVPLTSIPDEVGGHPTPVRGVTIYRLPLVDDPCGLLSAAEIGRYIPVTIKRYFVVYGVPTREVRGEHAHREQHQFLACVHGDCKLIVDDGENHYKIHLNSPAIAVHIAPMVWAVQYQYSADAVLLIFSSGEYQPGDYIRDYDEFRKLRKAGPAQ